MICNNYSKKITIDIWIPTLAVWFGNDSDRQIFQKENQNESKWYLQIEAYSFWFLLILFKLQYICMANVLNEIFTFLKSHTYALIIL